MNFVSKSVEPDDVADLGRARLIIDPTCSMLHDANGAGRALLGLAPDTAMQPVALDAAMPALAVLRGIAAANSRRSAGVAIERQLMFWTPQGSTQWACTIEPVADGPRSGTWLSVAFDPGSAARDGALPAAKTKEIGRDTALAHELRTPLAAIQAAADLLLDDRHGGPLADRSKAYIVSIRDVAAHGLAVVSAMLGRVDWPMQRALPTTAAIDLDEVVVATLAKLEGLAVTNKASLVRRPSRARPMVMADGLDVSQILTNLIANSLRHGGPGPHIEVRTGRDRDGTVWIEVNDTGPGLPERVMAELARSADGDAVLDLGKDTHRGLGLALSQRLAAANGARLEAVPGRTRGAALRIVFPANRAQTSRSQQRALLQAQAQA